MHLYDSATKLSHIKFCGFGFMCMIFLEKSKEKNLNNLFDGIISLNCFNYWLHLS